MTLVGQELVKFEVSLPLSVPLILIHITIGKEYLLHCRVVHTYMLSQSGILHQESTTEPFAKAVQMHVEK